MAGTLATPTALATASAGDAVRMWGKLGYPRRALRLHECARTIVAQHSTARCPPMSPRSSSCPASAPTPREPLRCSLTAAGIRSSTSMCVGWSRGRSSARARRHHRHRAATTPRSKRCCPPTRAQAARVERGVDGARRARSARRARRGARSCPLASRLRLAAGRRAGLRPAASVRPQRFAGTDRQVRGLLLDVLRARERVRCRQAALDLVWPDSTQRERALDTPGRRRPRSTRCPTAGSPFPGDS